MFFLFISGTEISKIPGLSAAGANPEVVPLTSPADADLVQFGFPRVIDIFPMDPDGHPTPAIITRAATVVANIPVCVVRAGSYIPPSAPYIELGAAFGHDSRCGQAVPDADKIFEAACTFARNLPSFDQPAMLAESVPGGTTTALLALRALGYCDEMVSSASPRNPIDLKEQVWAQTSARIGAGMAALADDPLAIVREMGDPMQASVLGFLVGLGDGTKKRKVTLAGGTQMLAVAALFKRYRELHSCAAGLEVDIATTCYVARDDSSSFLSLAKKLGLEVRVAQLDFSGSPYKGLRDYEKGFVKEGVGAGGAVVYAERLGISVERVVARTNALYREYSGKSE